MSELNCDWDKFAGEMPGNKALTPEEEEQVNQLFKGWLIMWSISRREKEFFCTSCHTRFTAKRSTLCQDLPFDIYSEYVDYMNCKHRDMTHCPICGHETEVVAEGKMKRSCKKMREKCNIVLLRQGEDGYLCATAYRARKDYEEKEWYTSPVLQIVSTYMFKPGVAVQQKYDYWSFYNQCGYGTYHTRSYKSARILEPFRPGYNDNWTRRDGREYHIIGIENVAKTEMKYSGFEDFTFAKGSLRYGSMRYLGEYCHRPQLEMVTKLGLKDITRELIYCHRSNARLLNWRAKDLSHFLRLDKQGVKLFLASKNRTVQELAILQAMKLDGKYDSQVMEYLTDSRLSPTLIRDMEKCASGRSLLRVVHYLKKQKKHDASLWVDYVCMARKLNYALEDDVVLFPKDLKESHDTAAKNIAIEKIGKKDERYRLRYRSIKKQFEFEDDTYCIVAPESLADIIREGAILHHCVGTYVDDHLKGNTTILFVRKVAERYTPYGTMEFKDGHIQQIRGDRNNNIPRKETEDFVARWMAWIKVGSLRDTKGRPIEKTPETRVEVTTA